MSSGSRKAARAGQVGRQLRRLGLQRLQPLDVRLELRAAPPPDRRRSPAASSASSRAVRKPSPSQRRMAAADPGAPRVHLLGDAWRRPRERKSPNSSRRRRRGARRRRRRWRPPRSRAVDAARPADAEHQPACSGVERRVAHRLEGDQPVERAEQLAHVVDARATRPPRARRRRTRPAAPPPSGGGWRPGSRSRARAMSMTRPPAKRRMSRSSSASISAGGRSLVSTIWRLAVCSASMSRSSSACISRRWVRNCTSSTSSRSTSTNRRR